ncbi:unnamed protein product [Spodoptera littoralis]|uniref:Protein SERAC1 n=1 Tax=Spodoptera littoralis TaxID=7109 RepID=A0A9P0I9K1_SPOLI|nr:unnamed protein product [Spodoptera littoralis]CAH1641920.1 unnamed protein product [Spodoptera littoralis]
MAASDVIAQDGGHGHVKLHPYLVTLVRWCVSCVWSSASVLLHRLLTAPLPQLPGIGPQPSTGAQPAAGPRVRRAGTDHLHPEPRVECVELHAPPPHAHQLDVIFVHGLYGSLGNTWRQGEWRTKYKLDPTRVPLRNHEAAPCACTHSAQHGAPHSSQLAAYESKLHELYKEAMRGDHYEAQAKFVTQLYHSDCKPECHCTGTCTCSAPAAPSECKCAGGAGGAGARRCQAGCGCVCDACYSLCWPRDWIKEDFPGARVISVNYTSDPYLWRPLWVKGNKRLRLHERAEQMTQQLLALGVGRRPVVWVGHSKGGLFIKQIYCDAYEAHVKVSGVKEAARRDVINNNNTEAGPDTQCCQHAGSLLDNYRRGPAAGDGRGPRDTLRSVSHMTALRHNHNSGELDVVDVPGVPHPLDDNCNPPPAVDSSQCGDLTTGGAGGDQAESIVELAPSDEEVRGRLWSSSCAFMFYSVPHRGSSLADIKAPLTARSVELMEIAADCQLLRTLQARWLEATSSTSSVPRPRVHSLVETCRTLMSVLWLRIVSTESADAGVGSLLGVGVDHREICKPSSRACPLYTELTQLIRAALHNCHCR